MLRSPDFLRVFYLDADAGNRGIGAVLMQEHNGVKHPLMFISKNLNSAEESYNTIEGSV